MEYPCTPFSFEEVSLFLKHVRKDYHCYFLVRFFTGLRTGEADCTSSPVTI